MKIDSKKLKQVFDSFEVQFKWKCNFEDAFLPQKEFLLIARTY